MSPTPVPIKPFSNFTYYKLLKASLQGQSSQLDGISNQFSSHAAECLEPVLYIRFSGKSPISRRHGPCPHVAYTQLEKENLAKLLLHETMDDNKLYKVDCKPMPEWYRGKGDHVLPALEPQRCTEWFYLQERECLCFSSIQRTLVPRWKRKHC